MITVGQKRSLFSFFGITFCLIVILLGYFYMKDQNTNLDVKIIGDADVLEKLQVNIIATKHGQPDVGKAITFFMGEQLLNKIRVKNDIDVDLIGFLMVYDNKLYGYNFSERPLFNRSMGRELDFVGIEVRIIDGKIMGKIFFTEEESKYLGDIVFKSFENQYRDVYDTRYDNNSKIRREFFEMFHDIR